MENSETNIAPTESVTIGESKITLLGTAHVSKSSAEQVQELLRTGDFDAVGVELCPARYNDNLWCAKICRRHQLGFPTPNYKLWLGKY